MSAVLAPPVALTPQTGVTRGVQQLSRDFPSDLLIRHKRRDKRHFDLHRVNVATGESNPSDPVQIAMLKGMVAGLVNLTLALWWQHAALPSTGILVSAGVICFLGYGVSLALFVLGLCHLGTARTGAYFSLAPFVGAVLAVVMLDEPLTARLLVAGCLMGFGLWLHLAERHDHEHTHDAMEHEHRHRHDICTVDMATVTLRPVRLAA